MKRISVIAAILALLFCFSVLAGASEAVLAQDHGWGHKGKDLFNNLTSEQRKAIQDKMAEMRSQDASREEIHAAVVEMLKGYGVDVSKDWPGPPPDRGDFGRGHRGFWTNLTEEQREAVKNKIEELRKQDASREEIHVAVVEMLKGYGVDVPEDWPGPPGRGDLGPGHRGFWTNLTEEQREAVKSKIEEMRGQGATREEIRAAVNEMIQGYGIESPGNSTSQVSEKTPAENLITAGSYPNPFNPETQLAYTLGVSERVKIRIYNITGQLIRTFDQGYQPAGSYSIRWDGRNENGNTAASGVYLYRIEAGPYNITNRMVLLK
jgi:Spy/CpxP family protein refolding chaperone